MNKAIKTILIISIAIFGAGVLAVPVAFAQTPPADNLVVEFEKTPLFDEANFMPGEGVNRWIKVTNNSGSLQDIAIETINESDPDNFSSQLGLVIKEGITELYNDTLRSFFDAGETLLSSLANGATTQYDLTITFNSASGNPWQGKSLGFDILIGFQGEGAGTVCGNGIKEIDEQCDGNDLGGYTCITRGFTGGELTCNSNCTFNTSSCTGGTGGGGGGGGLPPGLIIYNEAHIDVASESVTITWLTNYFSTSQVVYGAETEAHTLNLADNLGTPPKYGYAHTTPEYDISPKVTGHSVTIIGLTPGTTYYYRAVSHSSLAISQEHTFTTLTGETGPEIPPETPPGVPPVIPQITPPTGGIPETPGGVEGESVGPVVQGEGGEIVIGPGEEETKGEEPGFNFGTLLAAIGTFFGLTNFCWLFFLLIVILTIIFLMGFIRKRMVRKKQLILPAIILLLIILYCVFCCGNCWILILTVSVLTILSFLFRNKLRGPATM